MNKTELIAALAQEADMPKTKAKKALDALTKIIGQTLQKCEPVAVPGFGSFSVRERSARMGYNPQTGTKIKITAKKVVKFRPGSTMVFGHNTTVKKAGKKR